MHFLEIPSCMLSIPKAYLAGISYEETTVYGIQIHFNKSLYQKVIKVLPRSERSVTVPSKIN